MFAIRWFWVEWNQTERWLDEKLVEGKNDHKFVEAFEILWELVFLFEGPWFRGLRMYIVLIPACSIFDLYMHISTYI